MAWFTHAERPDLGDRTGAWSNAWPEFVFHDDVAEQLYGRLVVDYPQHQHYLVENDVPVAGVASIPLVWHGEPEDLPSGWDGALQRGTRDFDDRTSPTTLCALAAQVAPGQQNRGLSSALIERLRSSAREHGYSSLIAPVRPTVKHRYPLIPMTEYIRWRRPDGSPFDPWLRAHERLGGTVVQVADASMVVTGSVSEWERWTGLPLPGSGRHVVPGALVPVDVDRERDTGRYVEPNVWVVHEV